MDFPISLVLAPASSEWKGFYARKFSHTKGVTIFDGGLTTLMLGRADAAFRSDPSLSIRFLQPHAWNMNVLKKKKKGQKGKEKKK